MAAKAKSEAKGTKEVKKLSKDSRHHSAVADGKWLCGRFFLHLGIWEDLGNPFLGIAFWTNEPMGSRKRGMLPSTYVDSINKNGEKINKINKHTKIHQRTGGLIHVDPDFFFHRTRWRQKSWNT